MATRKNEIITVRGTVVNVVKHNKDDYVSLTDMAKYKNPNETSLVIAHWLSTNYTLEFLGLWEKSNNPDFNTTEFRSIKDERFSQSFIISTKQWVERTGAIGIYSKAGRYGGGTFAHRDIAFEFATWLSAEFKYYLIIEFQRLKQEEQQRLSLEWNLQRTLAKINYRIHTDAIKEQIIPPEVTKEQASVIYASEADLLNVALFGKTAAQWRAANPEAKGNIRDEATLEQLVVLSNLESVNAVLIRDGLSQSERLIRLNQIAITQLTSLLGNEHVKKLGVGS
ncbi:MAG: KilA-N domain-containing protein [Coriobacteriales bacterium]|jgi:hypothetical protein|nr:KilA-N domain-containing protein [Coriobacteriales bacterium]